MFAFLSKIHILITSKRKYNAYARHKLSTTQHNYVFCKQGFVSCYIKSFSPITWNGMKVGIILIRREAMKGPD